MVTIYIYFDEDLIEKIENFFKNYLENKFNSPVLDKNSGKITVFFEDADLDRFKSFNNLIRKWL